MCATLIVKLIQVLIAPTVAAIVVSVFRLITRDKLQSSAKDWQIGFDLVAAALMLLAVSWIDAYVGEEDRRQRITGLSVQVFDALQPGLRSDEDWYHAAVGQARESCGQILADPRVVGKRIYESDVSLLSEYVESLDPSQAILAGACTDLYAAHDSLGRQRSVQWIAPLLLIIFLISAWGMTFLLRHFASVDGNAAPIERRTRWVAYVGPIVVGYVMLGAALGLSNGG